jgi:hypothetical protein
MTRRLLLILVAVLGSSSLEPAYCSDPLRVLQPGQRSHDRRLGKPKDLNGYFPMTVPASRESWEKRRQDLREQLLVALGLWPMPPRPPLRALVHGKIDRDDYTIEKVYFASYPGHYVCGNLYRPKSAHGKRPGVLCPHGHWADGRFNDQLAANGQPYIDREIKSGAETTAAGARYPLQARCVQLARMGCVVFHYDMVGYADSRAIEHRVGFTDADAELRLQSFMGLQTFNSIRALDFLLSLPDIDPARIGVTGASGGGTQTFVLCAIDDRPTVAFPAVMVSTAMQGGCACENCSYLRQDTGNIELAGLFAPKPLGMTGANDWTIEIETKGLPELKRLYELYGAGDRVKAKCFPQFEHNYNQVSRELMEAWFNRHLGLGQPEPVRERPFLPVPAKELSVFDAKHPVPTDSVGARELRATLTRMSEAQLEMMRPVDQTKEKLFRRQVGTALRVMIHDALPAPGEVEAKVVAEGELGSWRLRKLLLGRADAGEQIPAVLLMPAAVDRIVVWIHPDGKSSLRESAGVSRAASKLLQSRTAILAPDLFLTGEFGPGKAAVNSSYAGFTFGYNRPLLAERVHDILTSIAYARSVSPHVSLLGIEKAGPWALLGRALAGNSVEQAAIDDNHSDFRSVRTTDNEMMLPGALKYGGLETFAALCAPNPLYLHNAPARDDGWVESAYRTARATQNLERRTEKSTISAVADWLLR